MEEYLNQQLTIKNPICYKFSASYTDSKNEKLVVLYNGLKETDDEVILKLSDSFKEELREMSDVEVRVSMLNINYGHNEKLLKACRPLGEYAWFIEKIREFLKDFSIENAVSMAISDMPETFLLKPFLMIHRSEVNEMLLTEYNEAEVMELFKEDGRREGIQEGMKKGRKEGITEGRTETQNVYSWLFSNGRIDDAQKASNDAKYYEKLLEEYKADIYKGQIS